MTLESAFETISRWNSTDVRKEYADAYRLELLQYLLAVQETQLSIDSDASPNEKTKAKSTIRTAMARLADEFRNILKLGSMYSTQKNLYLDPYVDTHSSSITDSLSSYYYELHEDDFIEGNITSNRVISELGSIAKTMNDAGYLDECIQVYASVRSSVFTSSFERFQVQKLSKRDVQTSEWGRLGSTIRNWNRLAQVYVISLFPNEKRLCKEIFNGIGDTGADACFTKTVRDPATQLFNIAEALTFIQPSPDKLFRALDLYDTLSRLLPLILDLFDSESLEFIRVKVANLLPKMAESVRRILLNFEKDVLNEQSRVSRVGKIHSLTRYVMNHAIVMCDYKITLMALITSKPLANESQVIVELAEFEQQNPLSIHFIWIIMSLISNLELKSDLHEDVALRHFFIMNNIDYIVENIVSSPELRDMLGDEYVLKLIHKLHQVKTDYVSLSCEKILHYLRAEDLNWCGICAFRVSMLTRRLKAFGLMFRKVQQDFENFAIWDGELLDDLKNSISEKLIPAYSSFVGHFERITGSRNHIKYSALDLETAIFHLGIPKSSLDTAIQ